MTAQLLPNSSFGTHSPAEADERAPLLLHYSKANQKTTDDENNALALGVKDWFLIAMISCAGFLNIFTAQSTILLLPSIALEYSIPTSRQQLITSTYTVSFGCTLLMWARLADIYGRRRVFIAGSAAFALSSILLPFSPTEMTFHVFRALQGISVAAAVPSAIGILSTTFPLGKRRNYAFVIYNASGSLGAVTGNIAGGVISGYLSWEWVFWCAAILGALVTVSAFALIPPDNDGLDLSPDPASQQNYVDWIGGLMITASLMILLVTMSDISCWTQYRNYMQLALSATLFWMFTRRQRHLEESGSRHPLIKLSIFSNVHLSAALIIYGCYLSSFHVFMVYVSRFYQQYLGLTVLETTWRFLPSGISCFVITFFVVPILSIIPKFYLLAVSTIFGIISPLLFALPIPPSTSYWEYGFPAMVLTIGIDFLSPVLALHVAHCLSQDNQSIGGGLMQTANNIGKALGLAIASVVQVIATGDPDIGRQSQWINVGGQGLPELLTGVRAAQYVSAGMAAVALVISLVFFSKLKHL